MIWVFQAEDKNPISPSSTKHDNADSHCKSRMVIISLVRHPKQWLQTPGQYLATFHLEICLRRHFCQQVLVQQHRGAASSSNSASQDWRTGCFRHSGRYFCYSIRVPCDAASLQRGCYFLLEGGLSFMATEQIQIKKNNTLRNKLLMDPIWEGEKETVVRKERRGGSVGGGGVERVM